MESDAKDALLKSLKTNLLSDDQKSKRKFEKPPNKKKKKNGGAKKKDTYKTEEEEELGEDPLNDLGFGICMYRDILWSFVWTFAIFSLLVIPQINIYKSGTAYATLADSLSSYEKGTLGNLGYSGLYCQVVPFSVQNMAVSCPYG